MSIAPYLDGLFVDPEIVEHMEVAFERVRNEFGLSDRDDPLTRIAARAVRKKAQEGIHDANELARSVINAFRSATLVFARPHQGEEPPRRTRRRSDRHRTRVVKRHPEGDW